MKVNKSKEHATVSIRNLFVGQTFTAPRKGYGYLKTGGEIGYYMKVDQSSGLTNSLKQSEDLAVNLETGQLRKFDKDYQVTEVSTECNVVDD